MAKRPMKPFGSAYNLTIVGVPLDRPPYTSDYVVGLKPDWARPEPFERQAGYDPSWLRYDKVDIYGDPRPPRPIQFERLVF